MKNENLVPKVRFKGFSDPWEQRKLKNIAIRVRGNDGRMELPTLTISATQGWLNQKDRFSENIAGKEQKNYTLLKKGQLSYNHGNSKTAKYGAVFKLDIYTEALVPRVYHSFTVKHNNSADFIEYLFATGSPNRELRKLVSSGARMDGLLNISFDAFFNINLQVPIATEQMKIAKFFRKTDNLIAANEDKLEQLKTLKKLMMQKIFSQEWRFKGFTDPWEQRKLKDVSMIGSASRVHQGDWREHGIRFLRSSDIVKMSNREIVRNRIFIEKKLFNKLSAETGSPKTDDVLITGGGSIGTAYRITDDSPIYFKDADVLWIRTKNINGKFLVSYFKTNIFRKYLHSIAHIGTISHYTIIQLKNTPIQLPAYSEQNRIGDCFVTLNSLIAANEDKLNQLKKLKKYLMQNMFV